MTTETSPSSEVYASSAQTAPTSAARSLRSNQASAPGPVEAHAVHQAVETDLPVARALHVPSSALELIPKGNHLPAIVAASSAIATVTSTAHPFGSNHPFSSKSLVRSVYRPRPIRSLYPWRGNIITTVFWIGEGSTSVSSTDNLNSAWRMNWSSQYGGNDSPDRRQGYLPAHHAATCNPFYVALPFNDLAYPDKARQWVPTSWLHTPRRGGPEESACQDRWIEIKRYGYPPCFAQWEDVGPFRTDHAEYVFGNERPTDMYSGAGLDISPAVAKYLGMDEDPTAITSWRFVEDDDVPTGAWLQYGEEALVYSALKQLGMRPLLIPELNPASTFHQSTTAKMDDSATNSEVTISK